MRELFDFMVRPINMDGFSMHEVLRAVESVESVHGIVSKEAVFMRDEFGDFIHLKCVHKYIFKDSRKYKACRSCRQELGINMREKNCAKCFREAIKNYLGRKYIDSLSN